MAKGYDEEAALEYKKSLLEQSQGLSKDSDYIDAVENDTLHNSGLQTDRVSRLSYAEELYKEYASY